MTLLVTLLFGNKIKKSYFRDGYFGSKKNSALNKAKMWINICKIRRINKFLRTNKKNKNIKKLKNLLTYSDKLFRKKYNIYCEEYYAENKIKNSRWHVKDELYSSDEKETKDIEYLEKELLGYPLRYCIDEIKENDIDISINEKYRLTLFIDNKYFNKLTY